jgi:hypothetical protein
MAMEVNIKYSLPKEEVPMTDCLNGQRWRAVCINMKNYLEDEIKNSEDFDSIKGLEMAQEKLWALFSYFGLDSSFFETPVDTRGK